MVDDGVACFAKLWPVRRPTTECTNSLIMTAYLAFRFCDDLLGILAFFYPANHESPVQRLFRPEGQARWGKMSMAAWLAYRLIPIWEHTIGLEYADHQAGDVT